MVYQFILIVDLDSIISRLAYLPRAQGSSVLATGKYFIWHEIRTVLYWFIFVVNLWSEINTIIPIYFGCQPFLSLTWFCEGVVQLFSKIILLPFRSVWWKGRMDPHTTWNEFGSYAMYMTWFSNSLICLLHILGKMLRCAIRCGHSCFDWSLGIVSWKFPHFPLCCLWFDWSCCPLAENKKSFWAFLLIGGKTHSSPLCNSQSVFHVNPDCLRTFDCVK